MVLTSEMEESSKQCWIFVGGGKILAKQRKKIKEFWRRSCNSAKTLERVSFLVVWVWALRGATAPDHHGHFAKVTVFAFHCVAGCTE